MESIIPIEYRQLYIRSMGISDCICLLAVDRWIEGIISHCQSGEEGGGLGCSICPYYQRLRTRLEGRTRC